MMDYNIKYNDFLKSARARARVCVCLITQKSKKKRLLYEKLVNFISIIKIIEFSRRYSVLNYMNRVGLAVSQLLLTLH